MSTTESSETLCDRKWKAELAVETELECVSILYAKSLLDPLDDTLPRQVYAPQRIFIGTSDKPKVLKPAEPPAKPQRFIARMISAEKTLVMTANNFATDLSMRNNDNFDYRCKSPNSPSTTKDEVCSTNDLEVAILTAPSCSVSQSTQTDDEFLQPQERNRNGLGTDCPNATNDKKQVQNSTIDSTSRFSAISSLNTSYTSETAVQACNYDSLPAIDSENEHHFDNFSSNRSSQRYSSIRQANINRARSRSAISSQNNNNLRFLGTCNRTVCSECGKRSNSQASVLTRSTVYESNMTLQDAEPSNRYSGATPCSANRGSEKNDNIMSQSWCGFTDVSNNVCSNLNSCKLWKRHTSPPPYTQLRVKQRGNHMTSQVMMNQSPKTENKLIKAPKVCAEVIRHRYPPLGPSTSGTFSTKSVDSLSNSSVDSGQGSGEMSSQGHSCKEFSDPSFELSNQRNLPSYARMANAMDQILRMSSSLYTLLNLPADRNTSRDLLAKTNIFLHIIEASPSAPFLRTENLMRTKRVMEDLQLESNRSGRPIIVTACFSSTLQKLLRQVLLFFTKPIVCENICLLYPNHVVDKKLDFELKKKFKIISRYLLDCTNKDRLLVIALEHLIHIMLFGEEMRLETIKFGGLKAIYSFCQSQTTPSDTLRLLLRALAVICNAYNGSQQVISLGGLELITNILCTSSVPCGVEAAGVLTQLTNPNRGFMKLTPSIDNIAARLLDVIDACASGEALLLCVAATANISVQSHNVVSILYQHNAVKRLIAALNRPKCSTIFVLEQIVTIFSRMATRGYEEALIAQGAIPVLFSMLTIFDSLFMEYSRRIQYKAAVCLGTISSKGVGLKAIYQNNGYAIIWKVIQTESLTNTPIERICLTIKEKLETKYEIESAV